MGASREARCVICSLVASVTACAAGVPAAPRGGDGAGPLVWEVAWATELDARVDASPIVDGDGVIVATRDGAVVRLDAGSGGEVARAELGGDVWATPAVSGGVVVLGVRRGGGGGEIVGLEAQDLRIRWRRRVASGAFGAATVAGGEVWMCNGAAVLAVDPADGRERRRLALGDRCYGAPAIDDDGVMYVATRDGGVRAFERESGRTRWQVETSAGANNDAAPVIAGEVVLVGSNDGRLYAFARKDGARRWEVDGGEWVVSSPVVAGDRAVYGDDGGVVRAVRLADGAELWRGVVGGDVASSPEVVGEHVVHGAHDGKVHGWRVADGVERAPIEAGSAMFASPVVTGRGMVVIATHGGRVLAIR